MSEPIDLQKILAKLEALEAKAEQAQTAKSNGGVWGWVVALVVGAIISIGAGLLIWQLNKKNEELARLRTQIEHDQVKARQLEHSATTARHQDVIDRLTETATNLKQHIEVDSALLEQEEILLAEAQRRAEAVRNWDTADRYNDEGRQ